MVSFSEYLKKSCLDVWELAHEHHPFVKSMGDGTLSMDRFTYFMKQDYLFLIDYCRVVAIATAKSDGLSIMGKWSKLLDETLNIEMGLHRGFCTDIGINVLDLDETIPSAATFNYTNHLLRTAYEGDVNDIAVSLLPCQWGYDEIGRRFYSLDGLNPASFHARWILGYNNPAYQEMTIWLRAYVDSLGKNSSEISRRKMKNIFHKSTQHELTFWEDAWNTGLAG